MNRNRIVSVPTQYYQHFDADFERDYPGEGYGGWKKADLELDLSRTALVVMHAWDCGTREQFPGWHRTVEYIPRSYEICERVFPPLLQAARTSGLRVFHVVRPDSEYYKALPGYRHAVELAGERVETPERIASDPVRDRLYQFRREFSFPGLHNVDDIARGQARLDFPEEARPLGDEGVAQNAPQLFALCKENGVNHLIYAGFAINGCLLTSPGGMFEMQKHGMLCSTIRQAVTAIENKETVSTETAKEVALWYVALLYGFVYEADDLIRVLDSQG
ncbi:hypothetical protein [Paenibacillus koleovorans]|uniref:hypothetical protein n=1 Tax=Paenibacillus koleovorans TaxID=121608 RepID=UPI000FD89470|nr:hypothetical protein [Paenibacillus koleovorans]